MLNSLLARHFYVFTDLQIRDQIKLLLFVSSFLFIFLTITEVKVFLCTCRSALWIVLAFILNATFFLNLL